MHPHPAVFVLFSPFTKKPRLIVPMLAKAPLPVGEVDNVDGKLFCRCNTPCARVETEMVTTRGEVHNIHVSLVMLKQWGDIVFIRPNQIQGRGNVNDINLHKKNKCHTKVLTVARQPRRGRGR